MASGLNLVMTVVGFSFSDMFILFVCTRLICARIHLSASRRSRARASGSDPSMLERGLHGLDPPDVSNFPTFKYREFRVSSIETAPAQCIICLSEYNEDDTLRILPICGHWFHKNCIDKWLQQNSTCPVCRVSVRDSPERRWCMQHVFNPAVRSQQHNNTLCIVHNAHHCYPSPDNASYNHQRANNRVHEEITFRSEVNEVINAGGNDNYVSVDYSQIVKDGGDDKVESPSR